MREDTVRIDTTGLGADATDQRLLTALDAKTEHSTRKLGARPSPEPRPLIGRTARNAACASHAYETAPWRRYPSASLWSSGSDLRQPPTHSSSRPMKTPRSSSSRCVWPRCANVATAHRVSPDCCQRLLTQSTAMCCTASGSCGTSRWDTSSESVSSCSSAQGSCRSWPASSRTDSVSTRSDASHRAARSGSSSDRTSSNRCRTTVSARSGSTAPSECTAPACQALGSQRTQSTHLG
jgi:hypothetical protein